MGPHGHGPERAGRSSCCPRSRPNSHPCARASDHPHSIDGLVAEHYRRARSRGCQQGLRGPARARVHASASARARARAFPSTHRGTGPRVFGCTAAPVPLPVRAPPPTAASVPMRLAAPAAPVPVRAPPRCRRRRPTAVLPSPTRRSRDDMMFDLQVKNILCCIQDFNNGVPEDDNDNDGAARHLRRRRK